MTKVMGYGAEGKEVEEMQKLLRAAGSKMGINGKYTIGMATAVRSFQKKHNLPVTGTIDAKTAAKLKTYAKPAKKAPARKAEPKAETDAKAPVKKAAKEPAKKPAVKAPVKKAK